MDVLVLALLPIALNLAGWSSLKRTLVVEQATLWRETAAKLGLLANSLAIAVLWGQFFHSLYLLNYAANHRPVYADEMVDSTLIFATSGGLAIFSVVAGLMAPRRVQFPILAGGLLFLGLLVAIPKAIL